MFRRAMVTLLPLLVWAAPAWADDPGRWQETGMKKLPIVYYQGLTHDPAGNWYFDGLYEGLWRTDTEFNQTAGNPEAIPPEVKAGEGYNHLGDPTWDPSEGGRLILPAECYTPIVGNTCMTGSFAVADPENLTWEYYVKLDPAEIPKAMWAEVSPDGQLIWTSAGDDLLAYRTADVTMANAAPAAPPIKAVQRLPGAVPPTGITGATFIDGRLFVAGQDGPAFQVWSIDPTDGSRRLEVERDIVGESEGLDNFHAAGGELHWLIQPYNLEGPPTYGVEQATLLHFVPAAVQPPEPGGGPGPDGGSTSPKRKLRLRIKPARMLSGDRVRVRFRVTNGSGDRIRAARVTVAGYAARTNRHGNAFMRLEFSAPGKYRAWATKRGKKPGRRTLHVIAPEPDENEKRPVTPPPAR
jgi:hypothetical protein